VPRESVFIPDSTKIAMEGKESEFQIRTLVDLATTSVSKMQLDTDKKQEEQPPEELASNEGDAPIAPASIYSKVGSTPEDMSVPPASTCSKLQGSDKVGSTPEDMSVPPASTCSKVEEIEQLPITRDVISPGMELMSAQTQTSEADEADMKDDILKKLLLMKVMLKEMMETLAYLHPGKKIKNRFAQSQQPQQKQISGNQTVRVEAEMGSSSDSKESTPSNDIQHSDTPQQQVSPKIKSPQKNVQQMEDSKNRQVSCDSTSQQVDTSTANASEDLKAAPKNIAEDSGPLERNNHQIVTFRELS
jgi:hypothetical protein